MKDLVYDIDLKTCDRIIELAVEENCEIFEITGTLQDEYLIYDNTNIKIGRAKPRKYLIINSIYLNEWSSKLVLTTTDNDELANQFLKEYSKQDDRQREIDKQYEESITNMIFKK